MEQLQLQDIHLPESASFWPLSAGWWILFALIVAVTIWLTLKTIKRTKQKKIQRKILAKFKALERKLKTIPMKENMKFKVEYILSRLKFSLKNDKNLTEVERDMILKEVKEKIKQIEEWNLG